MIPFSFARVAVLGALILVGSRAAQAQETLWQDDFSGTSYNPTGAWSAFDSSQGLGRTQFGLTPTIEREGDLSFARLKLRTFNDLAPDKVRGTEIFSKQAFSVGAGLEVSMRVRASNLRSGVVYAPYLYSERGRWPDGYLKEEVDFEFVAKQGANKIWSNIWNDWNSRYGSDDGVHNKSSLLTVPGMNLNNWTTYATRWYPDRVEWSVDGVVVRTEKGVVPDDPMSVHFNVWAPSSGWGLAYDGALQPTTDLAQNVESALDVDWVRVTRLPAPAGAWGSGDGLLGQYFSNPNLSGAPAIARVDARINFDWKNYAPDVNLPADNFSARWSGAVVSPFSENVTFTARADDGVRVWLNNQLVINAWKTQAPTDYSFTLPMTAGVKVPIQIEYFDATLGALAQLKWSSASMPLSVIPQSQLYAGDTIAPAVSVSSPTNGSFSRKVSSARGLASDFAFEGISGGIERVWLRLKRADGWGWNGSSWAPGTFDLPARGSEEWSADLPALADGVYQLQGVALDRAGNRGFSAPTSFTIENRAPTVSISAPKNGAQLNAKSISATGTASDAGSGVASVRVRIKRNSDGKSWTGSGWGGSTFLPAHGTSNWSFALPDLDDGAYNLTALARDNVGVSASRAVNFSVLTRDLVPPSVQISSVRAGRFYAKLSSISGTASDADAGLASAAAILRRQSDGRFWTGSSWSDTLQTVNLSVDASGQWSLALPTLGDGGYDLSVEAVDNAGNRASTSANFNIDRTAPSVTVWWPTGGVLSAWPDTNGLARDDGVGLSSVRVALSRASDGLWWNGQSWAAKYTEVTATLTPQGDAFLWKLALPPFTPGAYQMRAIARDPLGNKRFSSWIDVTLAPVAGDSASAS